MNNNIANQLKGTTFNYNGVSFAKEKIIVSASKVAQEGESSVSSFFSKPEFTIKKTQQLIRSLEDDGFKIEKIDETDESFEVVVSWA